MLRVTPRVLKPTPPPAPPPSPHGFDVRKKWYPVLSVKDTDPGRAHAVQVRKE